MIGQDGIVPDPPAPPEEIEGRLHGRFGARVRIFAARRLRDARAAEDVAQETLRRVLEALRLGRIREPEALPGFVFQTATNVCLHYVRSAGRERRALSWIGRIMPAETADEDDPLSTLIARERATAVRKAVDRLDASDRRLIELIFRQGRRASEIAAEMGLETGTVRVRKHRALRRLAEILGDSRGNDRESSGTQTG